VTLEIAAVFGSLASVSDTVSVRQLIRSTGTSGMADRVDRCALWDVLIGRRPNRAV
jgi:hypothetical protein